MIVKGSKISFAEFLTIVLVIGFVSWFADAVVSAADPNAAIQRVTAAKPTRKTLTLMTTQPGWIKAFEEAPLHPRIAGYVKSVNVDIGDHVDLGQVLIVVDAPELQNEVMQHEALVELAVAELSQVKATVEVANAAVLSVEAKLVGVEAGKARANGDYQRWNAEHNRIKDLASRGTVTGKLVDESLNMLRSAEASLEEANAAIETTKATIDEARVNVRKTEADAFAAVARIDVAKANLSKARTMAQYTEIKAPFAGVITERNVDPGFSVMPSGGTSSKPLLVLSHHDIVRVFAEIPETEAELVTADGDTADPVTVTIQGLSNRSFKARVTRTSWALNPTNRSLRTEIDIPNENGTLRPGMYATVQIKLDEKQNVLTLPVGAIIREGATARCCLVVADKIEYRPIQLGLRSGDDFEIVSGLQENDTVVVARAAGLQDGQAVVVLPPAA
jgi:HlyD family secretion protein